MTRTIGLKGKLLQKVLTQSKYKNDLLKALNFIDNQLEEMGSYGEEKEDQKRSVELLKTFIENRI
jgi:hypothetical protein